MNGPLAQWMRITGLAVLLVASIPLVVGALVPWERGSVRGSWPAPVMDARAAETPDEAASQLEANRVLERHDRLVPNAPYIVTAECHFDQGSNRTQCTFEAVGRDKVGLPHRLGGSYDYTPRGTAVTVSTYKAKAGTTQVALVMIGRVEAIGSSPPSNAAYWLLTAKGGFLIEGPALACADRSVTGDAARSEGFSLSAAAKPGANANASSQSMGRLVIRAHSCNTVPGDPAALDWLTSCATGVEGIRFRVEGREPPALSEPVHVVTNGVGVVEAEHLPPGTYDVTALDYQWCYAESDHVDASGGLVLEANTVVTVWVFFCGNGSGQPQPDA
jgi:hypothetical protein